MNLWLRLISLITIHLFRRRRLGPLDESVLTFRVWPFDVDFAGHMNNGRYLTLMDLGRIDLILSTGLAAPVLRHRWIPVVGSATVRFLRPLAPFQRFQLKTRVSCWDKKWFYLEQCFESKGKVMAVGTIKGLLRGGAGNVAPTEVWRAINVDIPSPDMPEAIRFWQQSEAVPLVVEKVLQHT